MADWTENQYGAAGIALATRKLEFPEYKVRARLEMDLQCEVTALREALARLVQEVSYLEDDEFCGRDAVMNAAHILANIPQ